MLSRENIMSGSIVGDSLMFKPTAEITRAEFVAMLMKTLGVKAKENVVRTVFYDDEDIPAGLKGVIASAYELGYIGETDPEGKLCFAPNDIITRAEAAMITDKALSINKDTAIPVIADTENCPEDALSSVNTLYIACIMPVPVSDEGINASLPLTREYAAKMFSNVKSFITLPYAS